MTQTSSGSTTMQRETVNRVTFYDVSKRLLDVLIALLAAVLFLPLWVFIAFAIALTSHGPVLYVAETVGRNGEVFRLYKLRTMKADNDESLHRQYLAQFVKERKPYTELEARNGENRRVYKIVNDSRVTPVGRILRATGLDEAPQFLNVLKGEMSVVGPRPPRPAEFEHYEAWHKERLTVMPGITGLYQVTARSIVPFDEMVKIDLEYIRRRSVGLDIKLMIRTIKVMILRQGGY